MCEDSPLLGPLPAPASRGEEAKNNTFIDSNSLCQQFGPLNYYRSLSFSRRLGHGIHPKSNITSNSGPIAVAARLKSGLVQLLKIF